MRKHTLALSLLFVAVTFVSAPWVQSDDRGVPHFNAGPPAKGEKLPPILTRDQLWGDNAQFPFQIHAYELAAKISSVIHQQPCYCYCDRGMGHDSLRSCFAGTHGANCDTCLKELFYAYQMNKQGKTAREIRAGIMKGEWKQIDLSAAATME